MPQTGVLIGFSTLPVNTESAWNYVFGKITKVIFCVWILQIGKSLFHAMIPLCSAPKEMLLALQLKNSSLKEELFGYTLGDECKPQHSKIYNLL